MSLPSLAHSLFALLRQPYPLSTNNREKFLFAVCSGIFVVFFLLVFRPFGLQEATASDQLLTFLGYGAVTTAGMLATGFILLQAGRRHFKEPRWTIGKQIGWSLLHIGVIGIGNLLYSHWLGFVSLTLQGLVQYGLITLAVGIFPVLGITLTHYIRQLKHYATSAATISLSPTPDCPSPADTIELVAENEKDRVRLLQHTLLVIESSDNYATIHWLDGEQLKKELIRSSLTRLEQQITPPFICRCHRTYIVNLHQVKSVSGNAQGYKLHLDSLVVPVARKYNKVVLETLQQLSC